MDQYTTQAITELQVWKQRMKKSPTLINRLSKNLQTRVNRIIPEKVHEVITSAIRNMVQAVLTGAKFISPSPMKWVDLSTTEMLVNEKIKVYRNTATAEGVITGAGGILTGLADFPLWLTIKIKMLFDIAAVYGFDVTDIKERLYILHIFQLTFSSQEQRKKTFAILEDWENYKQTIPKDGEGFDWRIFQQEYRDYIDIAKLLQLVPGIGAGVGGYVNHRLTERLGYNAMQAYNMRREKFLSAHDSGTNCVT